MNGWAIWLVIAGMAVGTIVNRAGLIMLAGRFDLPPSVQASLRFAPAAALAAIVVPELFVQHGQVDLSLHNVKLFAGLAGFALAMLTRNTTLSIVAGMLALHGVGLLVR